MMKKRYEQRMGPHSILDSYTQCDIGMNQLDKAVCLLYAYVKILYKEGDRSKAIKVLTSQV